MKHAICIMGNGSSNVAQETINLLDDTEIDFFVHWDKKFTNPNFRAKHSRIYYVDDRLDVKWGQYTEILAELKLLKLVKETPRDYSYVHLISSSDIPLMTKSYFKKFFVKEVYLGFQNPLPQDIKQRLSFYYPISNVDVRNKKWIIKIIKFLNYVFRINRLKGNKLKVRKGPNWFSIKYKYVKEILSFDSTIFKDSYLCDEVIVQTVLSRFDHGSKIDDNEQAARYIKWMGKSSHPINFSFSDVNELRAIVNTKYAFARKVNEPGLATEVLTNFSE